MKFQCVPFPFPLQGVSLLFLLADEVLEVLLGPAEARPGLLQPRDAVLGLPAALLLQRSPQRLLLIRSSMLDKFEFPAKMYMQCVPPPSPSWRRRASRAPSASPRAAAPTAARRTARSSASARRPPGGGGREVVCLG